MTAQNKTAKPVSGEFRSAIFGIEDGLVSTLGVVTGVAAGHLSTIGVLIAGFATAFTGAISMAAGTYISVKSEVEMYQKEIAHEKYELDSCPKEEKTEIRSIYAAKEFKGKLLNDIVKKITSDKKLWLNTMITEKLGLDLRRFGHPLKQALIIFVFFIFAAVIPICPFTLFKVEKALVLSPIFTGIGLFIAGALKTKFTQRNWIKSGIEMFLIGVLAAFSGFIIGKMVSMHLGVAI